MKRNHMIQNIGLSTLLVLGAAHSGIQVKANSAPSYWSGTTNTGTVVSDEDCPITVEKEILTFDIPEFPDIYSMEENDTYSATVRAQYTFHNPTDQTVNATLVFPFGELPEYLSQQNASYYDVLVNDEPVTTQLRHTLMMNGETFNLDTALVRLQDEMMHNETYSPDTQVMRYTFQIQGDLEEYPHAMTTLNITDFDEGMRFTGDRIYGVQVEDDQLTLKYDDEGGVVILDVIGGQFNKFPSATVHSDFTGETQLDYEVILSSSTEYTLEQYLLLNYDPVSFVSETDWYNACFTYLDLEQHETYFEYDYLEKISQYLMQWYVYDISIEAGQSIENTVTAPLYPDYDGAYSSPKYTYEYLLSPAQAWADFKDLTIEINTPYYMLKNSLGEMEQIEDGYLKHFDQLPSAELSFQLCEEENPESTSNIGTLLGMLAAMALAGIGLIIILIVSLFKLLRR